MSNSITEECFLITKDDYVHMMLDRKKFFTPKENKIILRILGIIAVCSGVAAFINIRESVYQTICWILLILIGFYALSYYDVICPSQIRKNASKFYEANSKFLQNALTLHVGDELFELTSEMHKVCVPQRYIYKIIEGKNTILVFFDKNEYCFIPKRAVNENDIRQIVSFAGDKYRKL